MKFTPAQIRQLAENARFPAENLEKVLRLRELLIEFHRHTILKGKLVLKGGTALNLFYLNLARLSVDIDLNYIGHVDREAALQDRPETITAVEQIAAGLGYQLQNGVDDYALREWHLNFKNHAGRSDRIQVEINFLMRACALPPQELDAVSIGDAAPCRYLVLELEELFGGKTKAMIDRHHLRDLYDLYRFSTSKLRHSPELLRKLAVLFASTMDHDLRTYHMDRFKALDQRELERLLYPLLRADDRPSADEMLKTVSPLLATVLDHNRETPYLQAMASGKYQPELLFPEQPEIVQRIREHPALLWKAANVAEHLPKSKKRT
jgi:predicted nucleotidyltransferase component of viral defense system